MTSPFVAERCPSLQAFVARAARLYDARSLPFHAPSWLDAWYRSFGAEPGCTPLWIAVRLRGAAPTAPDVALLPLVAQRLGPCRVVGFADGGVVDYAAPALGPGWPHGLAPQAAADALWAALQPVLRGHDALVVHKLLPRLMPEAGGADNPLALVLRTRPCEMFGNQFVVDAAPDTGSAASADGTPFAVAPAAAPGADATARTTAKKAAQAAAATAADTAADTPALAAGDGTTPPAAGAGGGTPPPAPDADARWERWRRTLDKRTRKEIERCWRVFHRSPVARFEAVTEPAQALALLAVLEEQQRQRMQALGVAYALDTPACRDFHRRVIAGGLHGGTPDGPVVVSALRDGEHVVSVLFGLANGHRYLGLRQSLGGEAWKACSPARLLDEATARHLHAQGRTHFDFGIGDYAHKQALQMTAIPLLDGARALTARGHAVLAWWRLRAWLKSRPALRAAARRWRDRRAADGARAH